MCHARFGTSRDMELRNGSTVEISSGHPSQRNGCGLTNRRTAIWLFIFDRCPRAQIGEARCRSLANQCLLPGEVSNEMNGRYLLPHTDVLACINWSTMSRRKQIKEAP